MGLFVEDLSQPLDVAGIKQPASADEGSDVIRETQLTDPLG
jgi:hypothetical protein